MRSITSKAICTLLILALMAGGIYWATVTHWFPYPNDTPPSSLSPHEHDFGTAWESDETSHWNECPCGEKANVAAHDDTDFDEKCDICGADVPHEHDFGTAWESDETNHWNECPCGEQANVAAHDDTDFDEKCDICGADVPHEHDFGTAWESDETSHWNECPCGEKANVAAHDDTDFDEKCDICGADVTHEHDFGNAWKSDGTNHWNECPCGEQANVAAHDDTDFDEKCDICGADVTHEHDFGNARKSDDTNHWNECPCGEKANVAAHDDTDFDEKCDICGADVPHEHDFGNAWKSDDTNHWNECPCGEKANVAAHDDTNFDEKCDICGADVPHEHDFGNAWKSDDTNHWNECPCGEKANVAAHDDTNFDEKCDICGADVPHEHDFGNARKSDETNHWDECPCGEKANVAAHTDNNTNGKCDVCSADVPLPPHEHSFGSAWKSDDTNHWNVCDCGEKANVATHADNNTNGKCDVCSADVPLPPHAHSFGSAWKSDENEHWQVCDCGERSSPAVHADKDGDYLCDVCAYLVSLPDPPKLYGSSAFVYDCEEETYTFTNQAPDTTIYPASITKLFTCYVALQYLKDLSEVITLGKEQSFFKSDSSQVGIDEGDKVSVDFLLHGTLMESGADAAYGLAAAAGYRILGNTNATAREAVDAFLVQMNQLAKGLGMDNTHFVNPDGYHHADHVVSFQAMVIIAQCAMSSDTIRDICAKSEVTMYYTGASSKNLYAILANTNILLNSNSSYYIPQAVGLKTGSTSIAGCCFLGLFVHEGNYAIIGVFGCPTSDNRWQDTTALWNYYLQLKALT